LVPRERWSRFPMSTDEAALRAVLRGTAGAALVGAPSLWSLQASDPEVAKLNIIAPAPAPVWAAHIAPTSLATEPVLRRSVDQAIASLVADGTIQTILNNHKFPATPAR